MKKFELPEIMIERITVRDILTSSPGSDTPRYNYGENQYFDDQLDPANDDGWGDVIFSNMQ